MSTARSSCPRFYPLHMSWWKSLISCHVVVRVEESMTVITHTSTTCKSTTAT